MPVTSAYGLWVTTDAASANISTGDFLLAPRVPVRAFMAPTHAGRDTGDVDRIELAPIPRLRNGRRGNDGKRVYRQMSTKGYTSVARCVSLLIDILPGLNSRPGIPGSRCPVRLRR